MTTPHTPDDPTGPDEPGADAGVRLTVPAPPAGVLDAARDAALDAFDDEHAGGGLGSGPAVVRDLSSARSRAWYERIPLGAVAAMIAVIALVGAFTQVDFGQGGDDSAATDVAASLEADGGGDSAGDDGDDSAVSESLSGQETGEEGAFDTDTADAPTARDEVGRVYPDVDALVDDLVIRYQYAEDAPVVPTPAPSTTTAQSAGNGGGTTDADLCDPVGIVGVDPSTALAVERVFLGPDANLASAVIYESDTGLRVAVVDEASCALVDDRSL